MLYSSVILIGLASSALATETYTADKPPAGVVDKSNDKPKDKSDKGGKELHETSQATVTVHSKNNSTKHDDGKGHKGNSTAPHSPSGTHKPKKSGHGHGHGKNGTHSDHGKGHGHGHGSPTKGGKGGKNSTSASPTATPTATNPPKSEGHLVGPSAAGGWVTIAGLGIAFAVFM